MGNPLAYKNRILRVSKNHQSADNIKFASLRRTYEIKAKLLVKQRYGLGGRSISKAVSCIHVNYSSNDYQGKHDIPGDVNCSSLVAYKYRQHSTKEQNQ
jgi:hypothetical protein